MTVEESPAQRRLADVPVFLWLRTFPGEAAQIRGARHWIESLLPRCDARETIVLITSEFAANAIDHTRSGDPGGQFTVHLAWSPASVRLTIGDQGSPFSPGAVNAALDAEHGRGLLLVDVMASHWGFANGTEGRLLWADTPWASAGGPSLINPDNAMPAVEAARRLARAYPGIQIGYDGDPAAWWGLLPGHRYPDERLTAPCFGALSQTIAAAWTTRPRVLTRPALPQGQRQA